jgi:hypothetical protein
MPGPNYASYDPVQGALALASIAEHEAALDGKESVGGGPAPTQADRMAAKLRVAGIPGVSTLGFSPMELTLLELHKMLALAWPEVPVARWTQWHDTLPASPKLADYEGCSLSLRFLQNYIDEVGSKGG